MSTDKNDIGEMFVDKYKPKLSEKIVGQHGPRSNVKKLTTWLQNWQANLGKKPATSFGRFGSSSDDGAGFRAALLSGPPGVGKTTAATLVCQELGYTYTELNASDTRSKKSLTEEVANLLSNRTFSNGFAKKDGGNPLSDKHVLIMDEVDGMAGNEDRGGIAELIKLIQKSSIPIICICNDRSHPKMRSLVNYCFDLRFSKPRVEQIKAHMMSICYKEGIKINSDALNELIISSNQDIRQVLHYLSLLATGNKNAKAEFKEQRVIKDVKLGPFDALKKLFTVENKPLTFNERSDLFFSDYSLMPLFVHENYPVVQPAKVSKNDTRKRLELGAKSIQAIAFANLIENEMRATNNWSLLPMQAAFSAVMPSYYMGGHLGGMIEFPKMLGKISSTNKKDRLIQELKMHMSLKINSSKTTLNLDYIQALRDKIYRPLRRNGSEAIPEILDVMNYYSIRKEDLDCMLEFLWPNQKNPTADIDAKTKAALTRTCNASGALLPYATIPGKKTKKRKATSLGDELGEDGEDEDEEEEDEPIIQPKKKIKKVESSKAAPKQNGKASKAELAKAAKAEKAEAAKAVQAERAESAKAKKAEGTKAAKGGKRAKSPEKTSSGPAKKELKISDMFQRVRQK